MTTKIKQKIGKPNDAKLGNMMLYISKLSETDDNFGRTKLNKLLFYCDFLSYLMFGKPMSNQEYMRLDHGPALRQWKKITHELRSKLVYQKREVFGLEQNRPIALVDPDLNHFNPHEIDLIQRVVKRFWKLNATEISEESHTFAGWQFASQKEPIPYSVALIGFRAPTKEEADYGKKLETIVSAN